MYALVYELHKAHNDMLVYILPTLVDNVQVEDHDTRLKVVQLLMRLFSGDGKWALGWGSRYVRVLDRSEELGSLTVYSCEGSTVGPGRNILTTFLTNSYHTPTPPPPGNYVAQYPQLLRNFLGRFKDQSAEIRTLMVEFGVAMLVRKNGCGQQVKGCEGLWYMYGMYGMAWHFCR